MRMKRALAAGVVGVALTASSALLLACPSSADDKTAAIGDLVIEDASATPAKAGETTKVTFLIENTGSQPVTITGLHLSVPGASRVIGSFGTSHSGSIAGLPVEPGEEVRLGSRTAWIEVGPLASELTRGTIVTGRLLLRRLQAPLNIHVSLQDGDGPLGHSAPGQEQRSNHATRWFEKLKC